MIISDDKLIIQADDGYILVNQVDLSSGSIVYLDDPASIADWREITLKDYQKMCEQIIEADRGAR